MSTTGNSTVASAVINAIQLSAADQARIAALNMAGRTTRSLGAMALNCTTHSA